MSLNANMWFSLIMEICKFYARYVIFNKKSLLDVCIFCTIVEENGI